MSRKLLFSITKNDLTIQTFRSGGKGGQHQNKRDTGVRVIHNESKAVGEARDSKSQTKNKRAAFERMVKSSKFKLWMNTKIWESIEKTNIDDYVNTQMNIDNLTIEVKKSGKWKKIKDKTRELAKEIPKIPNSKASPWGR